MPRILSTQSLVNIACSVSVSVQIIDGMIRQLQDLLTAYNFTPGRWGEWEAVLSGEELEHAQQLQERIREFAPPVPELVTFEGVNGLPESVD